MNNAQLVIDEVKKAVKGKDDCIIKAFAAFLAGGHILLEDVPGVGKTTLAVAFSRAMALVNHRVQFTPDVLPADILGFSMYQKQTGEFVYREGAVMCNLFLADEINRTSPKTQSALLEVMEEGKTHPDTLALCGDSYRNVYSCHRPVRLYKQCYKCQHHKHTHKAAKQCQRSITVYHRHIKNYCRSNYSYQKTNHDYLPFSHKLSAV